MQRPPSDERLIIRLGLKGTGLSSTVTAQTLSAIGGSTEQAEYLRYFRADSIGKSLERFGVVCCHEAELWVVKDCEAIRKTLTEEYPKEQRKWSILGQSFGGFCCVNYLSSL